MPTNMKKVIRKFKSGELLEKHVVATWKFGNYLSIRFETQGNQEKPVPKWPVAGPSGYRLLANNLATKVMGTISAFAFRHKETKKNLCRSGRLQDLPDTDF